MYAWPAGAPGPETRGRRRLLDSLHERRRVPPRLLDDAGRDPAVLAEQRHRHMLGVDLGVAPALRQRLRRADHILSFLGQSVEVHGRRSLCKNAACTALSVIASASPAGLFRLALEPLHEVHDDRRSGEVHAEVAMEAQHPSKA